MQNLCSKEEKISEVIVIPQPDAEPERRFTLHDIPDPVMGQSINGTSTTQDLSGFTKVDIFSITKDKKSQSHKKRKVENIVQDAFDFTATLEISNDQNNILEKQAKLLVSATQAEDDFDKMIIEAFEEEEARIEKERQNKATLNIVTPAK
ncbi:4746_t:CDS:2, partial [Dentiscutata heterogama]